MGRKRCLQSPPEPFGVHVACLRGMEDQYLKNIVNTTLRPIVGQNSLASNSPEFTMASTTGNARAATRLSLVGMSLLMASLFAGCSTMKPTESRDTKLLVSALQAVEPDILGGKFGNEVSKNLK